MVNYGHQALLLIAFRETKSQRKPVLMLSTCAASGVGQVQTAAGLLKQKPKCVAAYYPYMGDVDINDRKIYQAERPTKRYWKNAFFNVNDMALLNSYKLYRGNTRTVCGLCKTRHDFLCSIVESLCAAEDPNEPVLAGVQDSTMEYIGRATTGWSINVRNSIDLQCREVFVDKPDTSHIDLYHVE